MNARSRSSLLMNRFTKVWRRTITSVTLIAGFYMGGGSLRGQEIANRMGLILVDTKYEFGLYNGEVTLMDEIHTPDSSRYFYLEGYEERQKKGEEQKQLSKEFVREWLIANNFMGKAGQLVPEMSDEWVHTISKRYTELYEQVIGSAFMPSSLSQEETYNRIIDSLQKLELV